MAGSVTSRTQKTVIAANIKHYWGIVIPSRVLPQISVDQLQRIVEILNERQR